MDFQIIYVLAACVTIVSGLATLIRCCRIAVRKARSTSR